MTVFHNENNVALVKTRIETYQALSFSHSPPQNHALWTEWHRRFRHLNMQDVKKLPRMSLGIDAQKAMLLEKSEPPAFSM